MGTWVSPSWNPPKILVLISEVKQRYTIYLVFFFTVDLKQDYEGIFIVFFDVFLVPNITWKKKRRLIRLLAVEKTKFWKSQDLVTKLRETAKASLGEVVYTLGGDELDEFCRSNDCGGVDLVFFWLRFDLWAHGIFLNYFFFKHLLERRTILLKDLVVTFVWIVYIQPKDSAGTVTRDSYNC